MNRSLLLAFWVILLATLFNPYTSHAQNRPPIVDAGPDTTTFLGQTIRLQGSAFDPDYNGIVDWLWTVEISPPGSTPHISDTHRPNPTFDTVTGGDYVLSLIATDGMAWSDPDSVTIHVIQIFPPVAVATADVTTGLAPLTVHLDGSQSYHPNADIGYQIVAYDWNLGDGSIPSNEVSPIHTYTNPGQYTAVLRVFDDHNQTDLATVDITVLDPVATQLSTWGRIKALYR